MIKRQVDINELRDYIYVAFDGDNDIIDLYDKSVEVNSINDVCENIYEKIKSVEDMSKFVIDEDGGKIGYFAYQSNNLVSFGMNKKYRNKKSLNDFWKLIKEELGDEFTCAIFSYNNRAVKWLKKCGMIVLFENITILKLCQ